MHPTAGSESQVGIAEVGYAPADTRPRRAPWFVAAPQPLLIGFAALLTTYAFWLRSSPVAMIVGLVPCIAMPAAVWVVFDYGIRVTRCALRGTLTWRNWRWYAIPALVVIGVSGWYTRWPLYARFTADRGAFERTAQRWLAQSPPTRPYADTTYLELYVPQNPRGRVGSFTNVEGIVFKDERVVFFVTGGFFREFWGFVYDPDNHVVEPSGQEWQTRPLSKNWKTFVVWRP